MVTLTVDTDFILASLFKYHNYIDGGLLRQAKKLIYDSLPGHNISVDISGNSVSASVRNSGFLKEFGRGVVYNPTFTMNLFPGSPVDSSPMNNLEKQVIETIESINFASLTSRDYNLPKNNYDFAGTKLSECSSQELRKCLDSLQVLPKHIKIEGIENNEMCAAIEHYLKRK